MNFKKLLAAIVINSFLLSGLSFAEHEGHEGGHQGRGRGFSERGEGNHEREGEGEHSGRGSSSGNSICLNCHNEVPDGPPPHALPGQSNNNGSSGNSDNSICLQCHKSVPIGPPPHALPGQNSGSNKRNTRANSSSDDDTPPGGTNNSQCLNCHSTVPTGTPPHSIASVSQANGSVIRIGNSFQCLDCHIKFPSGKPPHALTPTNTDGPGSTFNCQDCHGSIPKGTPPHPIISSQAAVATAKSTATPMSLSTVKPSTNQTGTAASPSASANNSICISCHGTVPAGIRPHGPNGPSTSSTGASSNTSSVAPSAPASFTASASPANSGTSSQPICLNCHTTVPSGTPPHGPNGPAPTSTTIPPTTNAIAPPVNTAVNSPLATPTAAASNAISASSPCLKCHTSVPTSPPPHPAGGPVSNNTNSIIASTNNSAVTKLPVKAPALTTSNQVKKTATAPANTGSPICLNCHTTVPLGTPPHGPNGPGSTNASTGTIKNNTIATPTIAASTPSNGSSPICLNCHTTIPSGTPPHGPNGPDPTAPKGTMESVANSGAALCLGCHVHVPTVPMSHPIPGAAPVKQLNCLNCHQTIPAGKPPHGPNGPEPASSSAGSLIASSNTSSDSSSSSASSPAPSSSSGSGGSVCLNCHTTMPSGPPPHPPGGPVASQPAANTAPVPVTKAVANSTATGSSTLKPAGTSCLNCHGSVPTGKMPHPPEGPSMPWPTNSNSNIASKKASSASAKADSNSVAKAAAKNEVNSGSKNIAAAKTGKSSCLNCHKTIPQGTPPHGPNGPGTTSSTAIADSSENDPVTTSAVAANSSIIVNVPEIKIEDNTSTKTLAANDTVDRNSTPVYSSAALNHSLESATGIYLVSPVNDAALKEIMDKSHKIMTSAKTSIEDSQKILSSTKNTEAILNDANTPQKNQTSNIITPKIQNGSTGPAAIQSPGRSKCFDCHGTIPEGTPPHPVPPA